MYSASATSRLSRRERGEAFKDDEIFEGLLLALLSGNTQWATIERIQPELPEAFERFSLRAYAGRTDTEIAGLLPWFTKRKAGSARLRSGLLRLRDTAVRLAEYGRANRGADRFFRDAFEAAKGEPEQLAVALGTSSQWKLPGFGVPLAAEALRNIGYDVAKPDRHVSRAIAAWRLVEFRNWTERSEFTAPTASTDELYRTMCAVRTLAEANNVGVSYASSAIWTAGAMSGARLNNAQLAVIRAACPGSEN